MQSIGSLAGFCTTHQIDKMFVNDEVVCIKCRAAGEKKLGQTQTVEDPGEEFFKHGKSDAKITVVDATHGAEPKAPMLDTRHSYTMKDVVDVAVAQLRKLPMPEDIREFKRVQKVIKALQSLVENNNG